MNEYPFTLLKNSALKLGNLLSVYLSLKVYKVAKFYRRLYGGGHELAPL